MLIKRRSLLAASGAAAIAAPSILTPASAQSKQIFLAGASYDIRVPAGKYRVLRRIGEGVGRFIGSIVLGGHKPSP